MQERGKVTCILQKKKKIIVASSIRLVKIVVGPINRRLFFFHSVVIKDSFVNFFQKLTITNEHLEYISHLVRRSVGTTIINFSRPFVHQAKDYV